MASDEPAGPPGAPGEKKPLSRPVTWVIVLGTMVVVGGYFLWRRSKSGSQATTAADPAPAAGTGTTDYSGEVATLQTEIADLQSSVAQRDAEPPGPVPKPPPGGTEPKPKPEPKPGVPTGVVATGITRTGATLKWARAPNATGYTAHLTYQGKTAWGPKSTATTTVKVTGLTPDHTYTAHVQATGPGGTSAATNGPVIHTPR